MEADGAWRPTLTLRPLHQVLGEPSIFALGNRNENQFRVAFAVANIGSFGTLRRQERIF